jgi:DNA-binding protein Fis
MQPKPFDPKEYRNRLEKLYAYSKNKKHTTGQFLNAIEKMTEDYFNQLNGKKTNNLELIQETLFK